MLLCSMFVLFNLPKYGTPSSVALTIDGLLDFGPKWNYEYTVIPLHENDNKVPDDEMIDDIISNKNNLDQELEDLIREITNDNVDKKTSTSDLEAWKNSDDETKIITNTSNNQKVNINTLIRANYNSSEGENITIIDTTKEITNENLHKKTTADIKVSRYSGYESKIVSDTSSKEKETNSNSSESEVVEEIKQIIKATPTTGRGIKNTSAISYRARHSNLDDKRRIEHQNEPKLRTDDSKKRSKSMLGNKRRKKLQNIVKNERNFNRNGKFERVKGGYEIKVSSRNKTVYYNILKRAHSYGNKTKNITPKSVKDDSRFKKILVHIYNSSLKNFYDLRNTVFDKDLEDVIDGTIESFKHNFKDHVNNAGEVIKNSDKIIFILETIELVKKFTDDLLAIMLIKASETNEALRLQKHAHESFSKLFNEKYEYVCLRFGVCRSTLTFREFFDEFLDVITKGDHARMTTATNAFLTVFGAKSEMLGKYEVIRNLNILGLDARYKALKDLWVSLERNLKDDKSLFPLPLADGSYVKVRNAALDAIPPTHRHTMLWKKLITNMTSFMNGNYNDANNTLLRLKLHLQVNTPLILKEHAALIS